MNKYDITLRMLLSARESRSVRLLINLILAWQAAQISYVAFLAGRILYDLLPCLSSTGLLEDVQSDERSGVEEAMRQILSPLCSKHNVLRHSCAMNDTSQFCVPRNRAMI